ncbi:MAG: hypothetical protein ACK5KO_12815 [Arachnia sp.]
MTRLRVCADLEARTGGGVAAALASLPMSLRESDSPASGLVAVTGSPGWPSRVTEAAGAGAVGILVIAPEPVAPEALPETEVPVVIDYPYAGNCVVAAVRRSFEAWPAGSMIEVSGYLALGCGAAGLLLDSLALLRRIGQHATALRRLTWDESGYWVSAQSGSGAPVILSAHVTGALQPHLRLRGLAAESAVEVRFPDPVTARPANLISSCLTHATSEPTTWQSAHRDAWQRLRLAVTTHAQVADLDELRADLRLARAVVAATPQIPPRARPRS